MPEPAKISVLLKEGRRFKPLPEFSRRAHVNSRAALERLRRQAARDPEGFWAAQARSLEWIKPWRKTLDWRPPRARWFLGGRLNVSANCLDRHLAGPLRQKAALIWEGEPGEVRTFTYQQLHGEVCRFANVLKSLGVRRGDRVAIYMPMIPEAAVAMLACARIGAPHSVVFAGFSAEALRDRINDAAAKLVVTADGGWRRGNVVRLKDAVDAAVAQAPTIEHVVVVKRAGC
ncbi:MAG: AMP-binding protein, partial [Elusimicrobia bacterium]|nr:AMP-binding protein [Elusimicrobiota bacterium]